MTFGAISYRIHPGHEDEIAEIFSPANFRRASSPIMRNEAGAVVGKIIGTGLFVAGDTMVRVIQYDGTLPDVARHMARQTGVREAEERIAPYLAVPRDTSTVDGFLRYFRASTMRCPVQEIIEDHPLARLAALRDTVQPELISRLTARLIDGSLRLTPERLAGHDSRLLATAVFVQGSTLIRALQYEGDFEDLAEAYAAGRGPDHERALAPYLAHPRPGTGAALRSGRMRCISLLSVASLLGIRTALD